MQETVIKLEHITREFPGVLANDDVSLEIHRGEVFALVGENGAGKSTLMNIIYGIFPPTDGSVYIRGKKVETFSPKNAIDMGIGMVHQHFMLVPSFTVAQNIVMSREPRRRGAVFRQPPRRGNNAGTCEGVWAQRGPLGPGTGHQRGRSAAR